MFVQSNYLFVHPVEIDSISTGRRQRGNSKWLTLRLVFLWGWKRTVYAASWGPTAPRNMPLFSDEQWRGRREDKGKGSYLSAGEKRKIFRVKNSESSLWSYMA